MPTDIIIKDNQRYTGNSGLDYDTYIHTAADFARAVYNQPGQRPTYQGYTELTQYATDQVAVYVNPQTKHGFVSFRGTKVLRDVTTWPFIASNTLDWHSDFPNALETFDRVRALNPDIQFDTTGHSLGGALALYVSAHAENAPHATVYNPGIGTDALKPLAWRLKEFLQNKTNIPPTDKYLIVRNGRDPASFLYDKNANTVTYNNQTSGELSLGFNELEVHGIYQFTTTAKEQGTYDLQELTRSYLQRTHLYRKIMSDPLSFLSFFEKVHPALSNKDAENRYKEFMRDLETLPEDEKKRMSDGWKIDNSGIGVSGGVHIPKNRMPLPGTDVRISGGTIINRPHYDDEPTFGRSLDTSWWNNPDDLPATPLKPSNGPHATGEGPTVPPRNVHDLPPAYPHSDIDGGPKDTYDGYSNWDGDKIDPQHHYHDGESTTSYHSYDTNHHIQEPETASNLSQNAYTQAAKFFQRTFVSNPEMHRRGRNNVMWAELADVNGDLVEKAADLLAS